MRLSDLISRASLRRDFVVLQIQLTNFFLVVTQLSTLKKWPSLNKHKVCKGPTTTSFEGEVRDTICILAKVFEVVLFVVKTIMVKVLNINFNSLRIFRMHPSLIER